MDKPNVFKLGEAERSAEAEKVTARIGEIVARLSRAIPPDAADVMCHVETAGGRTLSRVTFSVSRRSE